MGQQIDYGNVAAGMAMNATSSLINNLNNELQMERTFGFNERAAKKADARTRALFTDLYSPEAKVKQLKKAGLSVGMMYGSGGGGGGIAAATTASQGSGAGGQQGKNPQSYMEGAQKGEVLGEERVIGRKVDIPLLEELHAIGNQMLASLRLL